MRDGDLVLEGGTAPGTGNVLIYKDGNMWAICDDGWNLQAAKVACKSLGFEQALGHTSQSYFGQPTHGLLTIIIRNNVSVKIKFIDSLEYSHL